MFYFTYNPRLSLTRVQHAKTFAKIFANVLQHFCRCFILHITTVWGVTKRTQCRLTLPTVRDRGISVLKNRCLECILLPFQTMVYRTLTTLMRFYFWAQTTTFWLNSLQFVLQGDFHILAHCSPLPNFTNYKNTCCHNKVSEYTNLCQSYRHEFCTFYVVWADDDRINA